MSQKANALYDRSRSDDSVLRIVRVRFWELNRTIRNLMDDRGQEDVKKLVWRSFRYFSFEPKCMPTFRRSLLGHPEAAFFGPQFPQQLKIDFFTSSRRNKPHTETAFRLR